MNRKTHTNLQRAFLWWLHGYCHLFRYLFALLDKHEYIVLWVRFIAVLFTTVSVSSFSMTVLGPTISHLKKIYKVLGTKLCWSDPLKRQESDEIIIDLCLLATENISSIPLRSCISSIIAIALSLVAGSDIRFDSFACGGLLNTTFGILPKIICFVFFLLTSGLFTPLATLIFWYVFTKEFIFKILPSDKRVSIRLINCISVA